jgi:uncharacterized membrane protein YbhN (UPF0104 family)
MLGMSEEKQARWKKLLRRWGPTLLSLAVIGGVALFFARSGMLDAIDFENIEWRFFALMIPVRIVSVSLTGLIVAVFTAYLGVNLPFVEWFGLAFAGNLVNILTPFLGGGTTRAAYLKARYNFPISRFLALLAAGLLITYLVGGLIGFVLLLALVLSKGQPIPWLPLGLMAGMALGPALAMIIPLEKVPLPRKGRLMRWVHAMLEGWHDIRSSPALLLKQIALALVLQLANAISLDLGLRALGVRASLAYALFIGNLTNLGRVTPVVGPGIREAIAALGAELIGISAAHGLTAALLLRLATWVSVFTLGPPSLLILSKRVPFFGGQGKTMADLSDMIEVSERD